MSDNFYKPLFLSIAALFLSVTVLHASKSEGGYVLANFGGGKMSTKRTYKWEPANGVDWDPLFTDESAKAKSWHLNFGGGWRGASGNLLFGAEGVLGWSNYTHTLTAPETVGASELETVSKLKRNWAGNLSAVIGYHFDALDALFKIGFEGAQFGHRYQEWDSDGMREKTTKHFTAGFATGIILEKDLGDVSLRFDYTFVKHKSVKDSYTSLWYNGTEADEYTIHQEAKSPTIHAVTLGVVKYF